MLVLNPCHSDARVRKEAAALGHDGFEVRVFALGNSTWPAGEVIEDGFTIQRIEVVSVLHRVLRALRMVYLFAAVAVVRLRAVRLVRRVRRRGRRAGMAGAQGEGPGRRPGARTRSRRQHGRERRLERRLARRRARRLDRSVDGSGTGAGEDTTTPSVGPGRSPGKMGRRRVGRGRIDAPDAGGDGLRATDPRATDTWGPPECVADPDAPWSRIDLFLRIVARVLRQILRAGVRRVRRMVRRLLRAVRRSVRRARRVARRSVRKTLGWLRRRYRATRRRLWLLRHAGFVRLSATLRWTYRMAHRLLRRIMLPFHRPSVVRQFQLAASAAALAWEPDIVHAHDGNTLRAGVRVARAGHAQLVYDSHELWRHRNRGGQLRPLGRTWDALVERSAAPRCDLVITVSDGIADWLAQTYHLRRPVVVVRNIPERTTDVQVDRVATVRALAEAGPTDRLVLYTGRITSGRGLGPLIDAMGSLPADYRLILLGYGDEFYLETVWKRARSAGVVDRLTILPPVPSNEVSAAARGADVAYVGIEPVCLSYRLALPNKLFEAIHGELPVVASDLPELRATVTRYGLGELFPLDDPDGIAAAIQRVCGNQGYREAARRAVLELDWHHEQRRLLRAYTDLCAVPTCR